MYSRKSHYCGSKPKAIARLFYIIIVVVVVVVVVWGVTLLCYVSLIVCIYHTKRALHVCIYNFTHTRLACVRYKSIDVICLIKIKNKITIKHFDMKTDTNIGYTI